MQLKATSDELREAWNSETTPKGRLEKLRALAACLDERLKLMRVQLFDVQEAAAAIKPITTPGAMAAAPSSGRRSRVTTCPRIDRLLVILPGVCGSGGELRRWRRTSTARPHPR